MGKMLSLNDEKYKKLSGGSRECRKDGQLGKAIAKYYRKKKKK